MKEVRYTKIVRGDAVQNGLIRGVLKAAEAVVDTLGPNGYTVVIDKVDGDPLVTKDGVTVIRNIKLGNPIENQGAQILKQVANIAQSKSGDGTTTATLLAKRLLELMISLPKNKGKKVKDAYSYPLIKLGMQEALKDIEHFLVANSMQVDMEVDEGYSVLEQVAHISSNNDELISGLIIEAVRYSKGKNPIKINKARGNKCYTENLEGMIYYNSVHHDYFLEGLGVANELVLKDARLFVTDHGIDSLKDISFVLEYLWATFDPSNNVESFPLIIIAPDFAKGALQALFSNIGSMRNRGFNVQVIALKAPEFGIQQSYTLEDIAIYTGGKAILKSEFNSLQDISGLDIEEVLGTSKMEIKRDQYSIIEGVSDKSKLEKRINYLNELIEEEEASYMQDKLMQRKAKLQGSISIIFVGAETPVEADEILDRVDDAVNAVKGAISDGVVKGGGVALLNAAFDVSELRKNDPEFNNQNASRALGYLMVVEACKAPFFKILENAELDVEKALSIVKSSKYEDTINAYTGEVVNIVDSSLLDPYKVTLNSLKAAVSVASTLISTKTSIYNYIGKPE